MHLLLMIILRGIMFLIYFSFWKQIFCFHVSLKPSKAFRVRLNCHKDNVKVVHYEIQFLSTAIFFFVLDLIDPNNFKLINLTDQFVNVEYNKSILVNLMSFQNRSTWVTILVSQNRPFIKGESIDFNSTFLTNFD